MLSDKLDPGVRALLEKDALEEAVEFWAVPLAEARRLAVEGLKPVEGVPETVARIEDRKIAGPAGEIPVRIYTPEDAAPRPAMVYFHGGGWVLCDLDTHDVVCRAISRRAGAVVVAVDYRLAPEHKFPAAVDDCYAALEWVSANAAALGVDARRIAVGGDSAGGNLGAVLSLMARERSGPKIALQVLVYPVTDLSRFDTPSYVEFAENHRLTLADMEWFRECYLGTLEDRLNPLASPLLAEDLRGLPPAVVITAECDPLRDEGEAFAARLSAAGVAVECRRYAGVVHPFFSMSGAIPQGLEAIAQVAAAIRAARPA